MSDRVKDLTAALDQLAASPAPPPRIDVAGARVAGRRHLRRRRTAMAGGTAAVVAVSLAAATVLSSLASHSQKPDPVAGKLKAGSDPLTVPVAFGWLPSWATYVQYSGGPPGAKPSEPGQAGAADDSRYLILDIYSTNITQPTSNALERYVPAEPVNGHPAYWVLLNGSNDNRFDLTWQTADGRWVNLLATGEAKVDVNDVHRIAAGVTVGTKAIPVPYRIRGGPPNGFSFVGADVASGQSSQMSSPRAGFGLKSTTSRAMMYVEIDPATPANTDPTRLCVTALGLKACAGFGGGNPPSTAQAAEINDVLDRITLLGLDPKDWTTDVIVRG